MIPTVFAEKICYYRDAIENPIQLVELIESSETDLTEQDSIGRWHDWATSSEGEEYIFGQKKLTYAWKLETSSNSVAFIYRALESALNTAGTDYANRFNIEYIDPTPLSISKYRVGAHMGPHVDYRGEPNLEPLMSAVVYLNDDYEGGEIMFPEQGVTIKPEAGSIVVFPSVEPFYHEPMPVTSGTKYVSPAFWIKKLS